MVVPSAYSQSKPDSLQLDNPSCQVTAMILIDLMKIISIIFL